MANPELSQRQNFESLLANHRPSGVVGIRYAHSKIVGRINGDFTPKEDVSKLDDGHFVIVPFIRPDKEAPTQVRYLEGEPQTFGTPVATVSKDELMGAAKLAFGTGQSIVAVPTWNYGAGETTDRVQYKVFAEERKNAPGAEADEVKLQETGDDTRDRITDTLQA